MRHFNVICYNELDDECIDIIFSTIMTFYFQKFQEEIKNSISTIIELTLKGYNDIKREKLPTPAKMHYLFNLRDISKVLQGISSVHPNLVKVKKDLARSWAHEMTRVFGDRFINDEDRNWLRDLIGESCKKGLDVDEDTLYEHGKTIIFADFMDDKRTYQLVTDQAKFKKKIENKLADYSSDTKRKRLDLVMFLMACDHVARISRILRQPRGNALLLGVGGSGRQSLARLATFINEYDIYQIDVVKGYGMKDFSKNVKECLMNSGIRKVDQTFLMVDTQIIDGSMLEYINSILNTGDVPNIYNPQTDFQDIKNAVQAECNAKYGNTMESNIMAVYQSIVQKHIHIVLAFSPLGGSFVNRLRMFPALVNCCTLDWFSEWPEDALESVAMDNFQKDDLGLEKKVIPKIVNAFKYIHKRVEIEAKTFSDRMRRHVYLTPTSYLELLELYKKINNAKKNEFYASINRLVTGLDVLKSANEQVEKMSIEIKAKQPKLEEAKKKAEELAVELEVKKEAATKDQQESEIISEKAQEFSIKCEGIQKDCEEKLDKVRPLIQKALASIGAISPKDLLEQTHYNTLTPGCEYVFTKLLYFKIGNKWKLPKYLADKSKSEGKKVYKIKEAMAEINFSDVPKLLKSLTEICSEANIDNLKKEPMKGHIDLMNEYKRENPKTKEDIAKASTTLLGLDEYLDNLAEYVKNCIEIIDPVREELDKAKAQKAEADAELKTAQEKCEKAKALVKKLNDEFDEVERNKNALIKQVEDARKKMERAEQLVSLLSGERVRWTKTVDDLKIQVEHIPGDALIAAGSICYNGPFLYSYRVALENDWRKKIEELEIPHTDGITMMQLLVNEIEVNNWKLCGLPNDNLSIENGIIIENTNRWPLMIDPQNQGSNFIKKLGKKNDNIVVIKASDPNFLILIKGAINNGKWVLLENCGQNLDPTLQPVLNRQIEKGMIKIGDDTGVPWNDKFKLHLATTLPNPHFSPETSAQNCILNFCITPEGLEEQMMTLLINNEMPELEQR
ncbi:MAG: hypothetical protein MJ252_11685, partial [archaeon]|nr:hypothetical protein [archaeon]